MLDRRYDPATRSREPEWLRPRRADKNCFEFFLAHYVYARGIRPDLRQNIGFQTNKICRWRGSSPGSRDMMLSIFKPRSLPVGVEAPGVYVVGKEKFEAIFICSPRSQPFRFSRSRGRVVSSVQRGNRYERWPNIFFFFPKFKIED